MIYIVHGDDISTSRKLIVNQQKKLGIETKHELNLMDISPQDLKNTLSQTNLFGQKELILLDVSDVGRNKVDKHIDVLKNAPPDTSIVLLANKSLPKSNQFISNAGSLKAKVIHTQLEPGGNLFKFADSVFSKNRQYSYRELTNLINEAQDEFQIYSVLYYVLRNIAYAKYNSPQFEQLKPFQKTKALKQAQLYTDTDLIAIFRTFYRNDKQAKTGVISPDIMITRTVEKVLNS